MSEFADRLERAIKGASESDVREAARRQPIRRFAARIAAFSRTSRADTARYGKRGGRPPKPVYVEHEGQTLASISSRHAAKELGVTYSWMQRKMMARDGGWYLPECRFRYQGKEVGWEQILETLGNPEAVAQAVNRGDVKVVR